MTKPLALLVLLAACATEPAPTQVYDFAGSDLAQLPDLTAPAKGKKAQMRQGMRSVQRELLGCYLAHGDGVRGTIALSLRLSAGTDATLVESVDVGGDVTGEPFVDCIRGTAMTIDFGPMTETGTWQMNYPFTIGA